MVERVCSECNISKNTDEYRIRQIKDYKYCISICRSCELEKNRIYREKNRDKERNRLKKYYKENKEEVINRIFIYQINNKSKIKEKKKEYRNKNKKEISLSYSKRRENDPLFKLRGNISTLIRKSLKFNNFSKKSKTFQILSCTIDEFKLHLESKFESWMSWENYGKYNGELNYGWDIDHIIPVSSAKTEKDIIKLNHYTNLQPLCSYTNRYVKRDNLVSPSGGVPFDW